MYSFHHNLLRMFGDTGEEITFMYEVGGLGAVEEDQHGDSGNGSGSFFPERFSSIF